MNVQQVAECIKRIFPELSEPEIFSLMNDFIDEFASRTRCYSKVIAGDAAGSADEQNLVTVADQRLYQLPADFLFARRVDYEGDKIGQLNVEETVVTGDII